MKNYLFTAILLAFGIILTVAVFNYRVDPYSLYHFKNADSATLSRIEQFYFMRIAKPWHVQQKKPTQIILGSSRAARVSPYPVWEKESSYNLSVPGMTVYEMSRFLEHAQANAPLRKLIFGLDFEIFMRPEPRYRLSYEEPRLARNEKDLTALPMRLQYLEDAVDSLASLPGFARSLSAFTGSAYTRHSYFEDGTWDTISSEYTGRSGYVYVGRGNVFAQRNERRGLDSNFEIFAGTLRFAHENNIETRLFITPEHVFLLDLWMRLGYEDIWIEFHRRLVAVNDAVAAEMGREPFPVYGFNQAKGVVDERIKTAKNAGSSYFEDGIHFRKTLGSRIMASVWGDGDGLGVKLNSDTVESYLAQTDQLRQEFLVKQAGTALVLRKTIAAELE